MNEMSIESLMSVGTGLITPKSVESSYDDNYDGYSDGLDMDLTRTSEQLHFVDTYNKLQALHSAEKMRMIKKIHTAYKNIGNTNVSNSVESYCNNAMSTEGAGDALKTAWQKIKQFLKMLINKVVQFFKFLVNKIKSLFVKKQDIIDTANNLQTVIKNTNIETNNGGTTISEDATCEFIKTEAKTAKTKNKKIRSTSKLGKIIKKTNSKKSENTSDISNNVSSTETESIITNNEIDKFVATPNEEIKKEEPKIIETVQESISKLLNDKSVSDYFRYLGIRTILTGNSLTMRKTLSDPLLSSIEDCYDALFVKKDLALTKKYFEPLKEKLENCQSALRDYRLPKEAKSKYGQEHEIESLYEIMMMK